MYIITQYAKVLKRLTRILTKKYRLYAAFSVFLLLQLSNFRVPELAPEASLVRSLKYLQDMLGLLHDDYINSLLVERLVASHPKIKELRYEAALFSGWEQAKAAYIRDGNLDAVLARADMSEEHKRQIARECAEAGQ